MFGWLCVTPRQAIAKEMQHHELQQSYQLLLALAHQGVYCLIGPAVLSTTWLTGNAVDKQLCLVIQGMIPTIEHHASYATSIVVVQIKIVWLGIIQVVDKV